MPHLTLPDGNKLYYEVHGSGPPLLLVPGLSGVATFFDGHIPALAPHFTVITHDHLGTGRSSLALIDYSIAQMSNDVLHLMNHLDIDSAHFLGHSTGGAIGQTLALDHPKRIQRLVLSATWSISDAYFKLLFQIRAAMLRNEGPAAYLRANSIMFYPSSWVRDHADEFDYSEDEAAQMLPNPRIMLKRIEAITQFNRRNELGNITAPTLIIGACDDIVTPAYFSEDLSELIPNAKLVLLPSGGHFFPNVFPDAFQDNVLTFLRE